MTVAVLLTMSVVIFASQMRPPTIRLIIALVAMKIADWANRALFDDLLQFAAVEPEPRHRGQMSSSTPLR